MNTIGQQRRKRIQAALEAHRLDVLVCALPSNVLMMSGYWPAIGTGVALAFRDGPLVLAVPEDELALAESGWADQIETFRPVSLDRLGIVVGALQESLAKLAKGKSWRIGYEGGISSEPASYAAMTLYGCTMSTLLAQCFCGASLVAVDSLLGQLRSVKTQVEIERIRTACSIAGAAFADLKKARFTGKNEIDIGNAVRNSFSSAMKMHPGAIRAEGFAWCMSGPNSALAGAAYAQSRNREIGNGEAVLVHCNSTIDGYWTDITRTWYTGGGDTRAREIFEAVFDARQAAMAAIRPGVAAASVDRAARQKMEEYGLGGAFTHSTGHGVGFGAINGEALPRLHPLSPDTLAEGMVFNVEPAAYFKGYGGVRHCDMVVVTGRGCEVLTPFECSIDHAFRSE